jgi:hypothetical protein
MSWKVWGEPRNTSHAIGGILFEIRVEHRLMRIWNVATATEIFINWYFSVPLWLIIGCVFVHRQYTTQQSSNMYIHISGAYPQDVYVCDLKQSWDIQQ